MSLTLVFDLDGVVYLGEEPVPGASEVLADLDRTHQLLFCTNNSSRTRSQTAEKIGRVTGFKTSPDSVLTSATAAGQLIGPTDGPAYVVGGDGIGEMLVENDIAQTSDHGFAQLVVVGVDHELTYRRLADATLAVRRGARFVATNTDRTFPTPEGQLPGAGAIVAALETATSVTPEVAGKPHRPMRDLIESLAEGRNIWMIGDRPDTDIAMANLGGWTSVLVLTGVIDDPDSVDERPTYVLPSIADLPGLIAAQ